MKFNQDLDELGWLQPDRNWWIPYEKEKGWEVGQSEFQVSATCPHCATLVNFDLSIRAVTRIEASEPQKFRGAALGTCPNFKCRGIALIAIDDSLNVVDMYPHVLPNIDLHGASPEVTRCVQEAALCYSSKCWRAAAMMIRRTLEVICDEQQCEGRTLHARLEEFKTRHIVSDDVMEAMSVLKLLGNDAAHLELREFDQIDQSEVDVAMELIREIIRAVYQHRHLVNRLNSLRKT